MKILIVDDHAVVRQGVRQLAERSLEATVTEAASIVEAEAAMRDAAPDVVVLDVNLQGENGLALARSLTAAEHKPRIVAFSMHSEPVYVREAFEAGVTAFVTKTSRPEELLTAIRRAMRGEQYIDTAVTKKVAEGALAPSIDGLSGRETEILGLIGEGKSMIEIAAILGVAYKTVANTSLRLRDKLGAKNSADLVRMAIEAAHRKDGKR